MKLQRRGTDATEPVAQVPVQTATGKGRATPKRRETAPKKQPVAAPRTAKEANQWRKQQTTQVRKGPRATGTPMTTKEYRAALKRGDESVLPRRDKGPTRKLTRDWVDTHRMASNYLIPVLVLSLFGGELLGKLGTYITLAVFVLFFLEWMWVGRRIHALAVQRLGAGTVTDKAWVLGAYAGQRSFLPARFRSPGTTLKPGDPF